MEERLAHWFDVVRDLLAEPLTELPHERLLDDLVRTLGARGGSWTHRSGGVVVDHHVRAPGIGIDGEAVAWMAARLDQHPLLCWFAATSDPAAQTVGRVPPSLVDPRYAAWGDLFTADVSQQMSIPVALRGRDHRAFVVVTSGPDFSDEDLDLARRVQGLVIGLDRQARALARWMPRHGGCDAGLTTRELAVLGLVAEGLTARAIGHRLLISPRTVHKHVEHIHAKLRVPDRVSAVVRAQELGLVRGHSAGKSIRTGSPVA